jgi:hypothetical protein
LLHVKTLTKTGIIVTLASAAVLSITGGVSQSLISDGQHVYSIVSWHIPFYGRIELPDWTWWKFTQIWFASLLIPVILWCLIGLRTLVSQIWPSIKLRRDSN